ncbi:MAG TPA: TIGR03668 family PPOX class F420-dependent oxidoreductase [Rhizomicrobium sp.]
MTGCRIGHLATADCAAVPHLVPVCFVLTADRIYSAVDEKPKRTGLLKRLANISENPQVAFLADRYREDWARLGWVMVQGRASIVSSGMRFDEAQTLLKKRYRQYSSMRLSPVIEIEIARVRSWGSLDP